MFMINWFLLPLAMKQYIVFDFLKFYNEFNLMSPKVIQNLAVSHFRLAGRSAQPAKSGCLSSIWLEAVLPALLCFCSSGHGHSHDIDIRLNNVVTAGICVQYAKSIHE